MEVILTGDMLPAERAHAFGLVNRLTEPGGALAGALELARAIVENGPLSVQTAKASCPNRATGRRTRCSTASVR